MTVAAPSPARARRAFAAFSAAATLAAPLMAHGQESNAALAQKLSNPVASLVSVPFQMNYDCCFGPSQGNRDTLNIQPVVPFSLGARWNLIVRTIVPVVYAESPAPGLHAAAGLGDTTQSFFFSPESTVGGFIVAIGPAFLWPTGASGIGSKTWGAGPTLLVLRQQGGATYGVLANHIWSFAGVGDNRRPEVNSTFVQPFFAYTTRTATTFTVNTESTYNWKDGQWTIPVNLQVSHLYTFGTQRVSLGGGVRVYAARDAPYPQGPDWGLRFVATLLFPH